jgi:hypothetical protein
MKHRKALLSLIIMAVLLGACNNFFHDLIPPDDTLILSFEVEGQLGGAVISGDTVTVTVAKGTAVDALVPAVRVSDKATFLPVTLDYIGAAFPGADPAEAAAQMNRSIDRTAYVMDLIRANQDFHVPSVTMPIDFSGPVPMLVIGGLGSIRRYTVYIVEDSGEPRLLTMRFAKYDNAELMGDALCVIDEAHTAVYVNAVYPAEIDDLSYALIPSFNILGDSFEVDGNKIVSGVDAIRFSPYLGAQTKTITVTREEISKEYTLTVLFGEDPDTIRNITDFRFNKADNPGIAANAVASIINTDNTGTITVQVYYSGAKPSTLTPRFINAGTVSVGGITQTSGVNSRDYQSPVEYRVVSRNGMYTRIYTVKVEFINVTDSAPRITAFRFSAALNGELVQDAQGQITDGTIYIDAHYGGTSMPTGLVPEFSAQGLVTVSGSVQVSGASAQDFTRQIKYTVTNPLNPNLSRDYWVQCRMIQETSSYAAITSFGFYPEDNPGIENELAGKIDQVNGKITVYAPAGSGVTERIMIPRFTASGQVRVEGTAQVSGVSGRVFDAPVTFTVVSANGKNTRSYAVSVREPKSPLYVSCNAYGYGDGSSWENAFTSLKAACEAAAEFPEAMSKEIWIAAGTYTPGRTPEDYLRLTANTSYIGGFAGWETDKGQRNVAANTVTISGDLGGGVTANNLFSIAYKGEFVEGKYGNSYFQITLTTINGSLTFENLRIENARCTQDQCFDGSFWFNMASGIFARMSGNADVVIKNCDFNDIKGSCAIGIYSGNTFLLTDCNFNSCSVIMLGNYYEAAKSATVGNTNIRNSANAAITIGAADTNIDSLIIDNAAWGGLEVYGVLRFTNSIIKNCGGNGINNNNSSTVQPSVYENFIVENCTGRGVFIYGGGNLTINSGRISNNSNSGVEMSDGTFIMNGGTISDNTAVTGGGVSMGSGGTFIMNSGTISGNSATHSLYTDGLDYAEGGGVMCWEGANFIMRGGTISGNSAAYKGGGVSLRNGTITKTGGTIYGSDGGANANRCIRADGWGRAVFKSPSGYVSDYRYVNTTLGPLDNLSW